MTIPFDHLSFFLSESFRIEGITEPPTIAHLMATEDFLGLDAPSIFDVAKLVSVYQPDAILRTQPHLNVRVGNHVAPRGGPAIEGALKALLAGLAATDPWATHVAYETLHPFTDGNGRSGRAIWAWQMIHRFGPGALALGFLHRFYYQTLEQRRVNREVRS